MEKLSTNRVRMINKITSQLENPEDWDLGRHSDSYVIIENGPIQIAYQKDKLYHVIINFSELKWANDSDMSFTGSDLSVLMVRVKDEVKRAQKVLKKSLNTIKIKKV